MNLNKLLWGIFLILLGGLLILENLNLIDFYWVDLLSLWPALLILWGVSILPVKSGWKALVSLLVILVSLTYALQDNSGNRLWFDKSKHSIEFNFDADDEGPSKKEVSDTLGGKMDFQREQFPFDSAMTNAKLKFDGAAGIFTISDTCHNFLFDFKKKGNIGQYEINHETDNGIYNVDIELKNKTIRGRNNFNEAIIKLNNNPIWSIDLNLGAAEANMDLKHFKIENIEVDGGASDIEITLGDLYKKTNIDVKAGASNLILRIPESSGCEVRFQTFLAGKDLEGFIKESGKIFHTPKYKQKEHLITVLVEAAVSNFKVVQY